MAAQKMKEVNKIIRDVKTCEFCGKTTRGASNMKRHKDIACRKNPGSRKYL